MTANKDYKQDYQDRIGYHKDYYQRNKVRLNKLTRQSQIKNQASFKAYQKKYEDDNREYRRLQQRNTRYLRLHNISAVDYDNLLESQQYKCKICNSENVKFHLDHCHKTGEIRGILCQKCNMALGLLNDDVSILKVCIEYIQGGSHYS